MSLPKYQRPQFAQLKAAFSETVQARTEPDTIQVLLGPRQVGKTTLAQQLKAWAAHCGLPVHFQTADAVSVSGQQGSRWLTTQWQRARDLAEDAEAGGSLLILDEVQKVDDWGSSVKFLWEEDRQQGRRMQVLLLGSSLLLLRRGMESLLGRYEQTYLPHWSFQEMHEAFGFALQDYVYYGGYPKLGVIKNKMHFMRDSIVEPMVTQDIVELATVRNPALMRRLFELSCRYSAQITSYNKLASDLGGQGHHATIAHYHSVLQQASIVAGLRNFTGNPIRQARSHPKHQVFANALLTAQLHIDMEVAIGDPARWGRIVESAAGTHLLGLCANTDDELYYWRKKDDEVDFVLCRGHDLCAVEVASGLKRHTVRGLEKFEQAFGDDYRIRSLLVGAGGDMELREFFLSSADALLPRQQAG